jgi:hypothetical protein
MDRVTTLGITGQPISETENNQNQQISSPNPIDSFINSGESNHIVEEQESLEMV